MTSATAKGFPYPVGNVDKLADADLHIKALADFLNDNSGRIKYGSGTVDIISSGTTASLAVVFATAYPVGVTPIVVCTPASNQPGDRHAIVSGISNTGFTIYAKNTTSTADIVVNWIAIGG